MNATLRDSAAQGESLGCQGMAMKKKSRWFEPRVCSDRICHQEILMTPLPD
jgi:hypothetical protein